MANVKNIRLISDLPIGEGEKEDGLDFDVYARIISWAVRNTPSPFSVGLFGPWGAGKTSLMRMIKKQIDGFKTGKNITIWFNAWKHGEDPSPVAALIAHIIDQVEEHKNFPSNLFEEFKKGLEAVASGISITTNMNVNFGLIDTKLEGKVSGKDINDTLDKLNERSFKLEDSLYNAYKALDEVSKKVAKKKVKIVLFIDDLDRCLPESALKILESIKLIFNQPSFSFVVGMSKTIIEKFLESRYDGKISVEDINGQEYLDKIIQLPFNIPSHQSRIESYAKKIIAELDDDVKKALKKILPIVALASDSNPRKTIRFVNKILIDRQILQSSIKDDVRISFLAISEAIRMTRSWRPYLNIADHNKLCDILARQLKQESDYKFLPEADDQILTPIEKNLFDELMTFFDANNKGLGLKNLLSSKQGIQWLTKHKKRAQTKDFITAQETKERVNDLLIVTMIEDRSAARRIEKALESKGINVVLIKELVQTEKLSEISHHPNGYVLFLISTESLIQSKINPKLIKLYQASIALGNTNIFRVLDETKELDLKKIFPDAFTFIQPDKSEEEVINYLIEILNR